MWSSRTRRIVVAVVAGTTLVSTRAPAAIVSSVFGGRVPCVVRDGVQFCEGSLARRVETWDGVPLDANVTLPPPTTDRPFPLIVDIHGWGIGKIDAPLVDRALEGYAVLSYSARGFLQSCGYPESRAPDPTLSSPNACADRGWIRLADARYEARDTQYLAGLLADEGLVHPDRIGVTGASYGGGQSMILAVLKDRVMLPDGTLVPWESANGYAMKIAAAAPIIPWSDLAYALVPNGRTLDYRTLNPYGERGGVMKKSWVDTLFTVGAATGFYAPPGADPDADLVAWNARLDMGESYDTDPFMRDALDEITRHHSAYYVDDSVEPAPLFIYNAWTDDLFPVDEAIRFWRKIKSRHPTAEIALQFADAFGHPRSDLFAGTARIQRRVGELFARHLKDAGPLLPPLEVFTQTCGGSTAQGPFAAADWDAVHPGEVRHADAAAKAFDAAGGNAETARKLNPLAGGPCRAVPATDDPGAATYRLPAVGGGGYTLMGSPTVIADFAVRGSVAQVVARLWDVAPSGSQALVSHALYRPRTDGRGPQVFQLHPNGWHFAAGHEPKLELLGQSPPFGRAPNGFYVISVSNLELRLPMLEAPDGATIQSPAAAVFPPADLEPPGCAPAPLEGCRAPAAARVSRLVISRGKSDRLAWRWTKGAATAKAEFGDPLATTGYAFCVYDGGGRPIASLAAPAGARCAGESCWTSTKKGFGYRDPAGSVTGLVRLGLRAGVARKAQAVVEADGAELDLPAMPMSLPLTVQLVASNGGCWGASFASAQANQAKRFRAKSN